MQSPVNVLAERLNELAQANADGLLNDEEYRLLRQGAFEQLGASPAVHVPTQTPAVNTCPPGLLPQAVPQNKSGRLLHFDSPPAKPPPPLRSKPSFTSSLANLLRRSGTRRTVSDSTDQHHRSQSAGLPKIHTNPPNDISSSAPASADPLSPSATKFKWTTTIPKVLSTKSSKPSLSKAARERAFSTSNVSSSSSSERKHSHQSSVSSRGMTVASSMTSTSSLTSPVKPSFSISNLLIDEDHLQTSQEIRQAILTLENEGKKLIASFNELERTKVRQRRLEDNANGHHGSYLTTHLTPASASSSTLLSVSKSRRGPIPVNNLFDGDDMSEMSTGRDSSQSKQRKRSMSTSPSVVSVNTIASSRGRPSISTRPHIVTNNTPSPNSKKPTSPTSFLDPTRKRGLMKSRSAGNLSGSISFSLSSLAETTEERAIDVGEEVREVRKQRTEVIARYDERLSFLRAKLKSAELHEKLMRR